MLPLLTYPFVLRTGRSIHEYIKSVGYIPLSPFTHANSYLQYLIEDLFIFSQAIRKSSNNQHAYRALFG